MPKLRHGQIPILLSWTAGNDVPLFSFHMLLAGRINDILKRTWIDVRGVKVEVGQKATYERTFTVKDIELFAELSGDKGLHHMLPDGEGRIMVQGLLTATLPTKLGGDINYIARRMDFEFIRPVFAGDTVKAEAVITGVAPYEKHLEVTIRVVCVNQHGKEVLTGNTWGVIRS